MKASALQSFQLKNFKAVRDSGVIKFTPLTVFIGNNGSGKSSIVEGLETLQDIAMNGVDRATQQWGGFEQIINKAVSHGQQGQPDSQIRSFYENPMRFDLRGKLENRISISAMLEVAHDAGKDELFISNENLSQKGRNTPSFAFQRDSSGHVSGDYTLGNVRRTLDIPDLLGNTSLLDLKIPGFPYELPVKNFISSWQFVSLIPQHMGNPAPRSRGGGPVRLEKDGSNIADYLLSIKRMSPEAFESIVDALKIVLPYLQDLEVVLSELGHTAHLQLSEGNFTVPGWLLSTGTLRIVALLALLRHPEPPPLVIIEEIENGLDPISVHLIVDEIRDAIENDRTQVIITTHSPYLLDLLSLSHIILVERIDGQPTFSRPGDQESLQKWAERFGPGRLYVTNKLGRERQA